MRILHVANYAYSHHGAAFYNCDRKLSAGFVRNGHFVYEFSHRDMARLGTVFRSKRFGIPWINAELLRICENMEPDLVLLGHAQIVKPSTLAAMKRRWPQMHIALWYVDPLFHEEKTRYMREMAPYLDAVFATTGGEYLERLIEVPRAYFPNPVDHAVECLENFRCREFGSEVIFCGVVGDDVERSRFMRAFQDGLAGVPLRFHGLFGEPQVTGMDYLRALGSARMGLNHSRRNDVALYSSDRVAQLTGNGLLTLTPRIPGFEVLFRQGEVVYFNDVDEAVERVRHYAARPDEAAVVAEAGWRRAHAVCAADRVARFMEDFVLSNPFREAYEWQDEIYGRR